MNPGHVTRDCSFRDIPIYRFRHCEAICDCRSRNKKFVAGTVNVQNINSSSVCFNCIGGVFTNNPYQSLFEKLLYSYIRIDWLIQIQRNL